MKRRAPPSKDKEAKGRNDPVISTGSTLLDLAISGGRYRRGGIPGGILVEIFGPSSTGKTVLLSEIAGNVQRKGGDVEFFDPEGRLNKQFALLFGLDIDAAEYAMPNTVPEIFQPIFNWDKKPLESGYPHGIFADSLAALSTDLEMDSDEGDKMGMRRAKEFSEQLRKVCRKLPDHNILMVCSNQIRQNLDAGPWGAKYKSPGGEAIPFYSSLRLRTALKGRIKRERSVRGKKHSIVTGVEIEVEVFKSSVWSPYRKAPVYIGFDYGIDDVKANLQYLKTNTGAKDYRVGNTKLASSLEAAAANAEEGKLEPKLKRETIALWKEIEEAFTSERKKRHSE